VIEVDPPGKDIASGRRWLRLADHARWLAQAIRLDRDEPGWPWLQTSPPAGSLRSPPPLSQREHAPDSATRRTHEHLVTWIGGARLEVW
jgi:hypothetical protein